MRLEGSAYNGRSLRGAFSYQFEITINHHLDQLFETHAGFPSKFLSGFRAVTSQMVDLRRPEKLRIDLNVFAIVQPGASEGDLQQAPYAMSFPGRHNVVIGPLLLKHHPHRPYVVPSEPPVALRVEIPHLQFLLKPKFNAGSVIADPPTYKLDTTARRLVVEQNT